MCRRLLPALLLPLALGSPAAAARASASHLLVREPGRAVPAVVVDEQGLAVDLATGSARLSLPPGARVEAVVGLDGGWLLAATRPEGGDREILLLADRGDGAAELPPPGDRAAGRSRPVPVVAAGELLGLLWLEGASETSNGIRWAAWSGTGFDAPIVVAPPGPGSQLALAAARLDDGRVVAVWAGYDGTDDEIWASVLSGQAWSDPVRVAEDNRVPDITPAVTAAPGGAAWVAWSRYDGSEYRVATARFDGRQFAGSIPVGAPGSLYPSFEHVGDDTFLLWFDAGSDLWTLAGIAPGGQLLVHAVAPGSSTQRPTVSRAGDRVLFRFDAEQREAAWK